MIEVQCQDCRYAIKAKDALAGKTVLCPECKARVKLPRAEAQFEVIEEVTPVRRRAAPSHEAVRVPTKRIRPPIDDDDDDEVERRPQRRVRRRRRKSEWGSGQLYVGLAIFAAFILIAILGFKFRGAAVFAMSFGVIISWVGGIWLLVVAFNEDSTCGVLCIVVPFYGIYYAITRWDDCKLPVAIELGGFVIMALGAIASAGHENKAGQLEWGMLHQPNVVHELSV